jgi:hypothetical protein
VAASNCAERGVPLARRTSFGLFHQTIVCQGGRAAIAAEIAFVVDERKLHVYGFRRLSDRKKQNAVRAVGDGSP